MGQLHNLHPQLFDTAQYQVAQKPAVSPEVDPDDAFIAKLNAAEDRGTHLAMFAPAHELARSHSKERPYGRDPQEWAANKIQQSEKEQSIGSGRPVEPGENSTAESIRRYGVMTPVKVSQHDSYESGAPSFELQHGHHRVYTANVINPAMEIPLVHADRERGRDLVKNPMASEISMGGDWVKGGWTDPTVKRR